MASRSEEVSHRILTVPNVLSFMRLALVPVFLVLIIAGRDVYALIVLVISSASDYVDGVIARRFKQVTRLGQLLDPFADRLFIFAALIGLAVREVIPWWLFVVIVARDTMLLVLAMVLAAYGFGPLPVHRLGKAATLCLFYSLPILMIGEAFPTAASFVDPIGWAFALWGMFLYWWAGIVYAAQTVTVTRLARGEAALLSDTVGEHGGNHGRIPK